MQIPSVDDRQSLYHDHQPQQPVPSPSHYAYSPTERAYPPKFPPHNAPPPSPHAATYNRAQPPSPSEHRMPFGHSHATSQDRPTSSYYDPTSDSRDRTTGYNQHTYQPRSPVQASGRANPMSVMSILSETSATPPAVTPAPPAGRQSRKSSKSTAPPPPLVKQERPPLPVHDVPPRRSSIVKAEQNGDAVPPPLASQSRVAPPIPQGPPGLSVKATEIAYAEIEAHWEDSDLDTQEFAGAICDWQNRTAKRALEVEALERTKRKKLQNTFEDSADASRALYILSHEHEVEQEVKNRE
ncbi:hypothetical protein LTR28_008257, partial [Elasticomyces elasticus]